MKLLYRCGILSLAGTLLAGCATWLHNSEGGRVEIQKIKAAVECELAAVALNPNLAPADIDRWRAKSTLDLTLVASASADGGFTYVLRTVDPLKLVPSAGGGFRDLSTAHLEFASSFAKAKLAHADCVSGPDPSGTGMGLAAWFESTLLAIPRGEFGGLTFTTEFELNANAATRFGYTFTKIFGDVGGGGKLSHTHRLTVAINQPPPDAPPIAVYIVPAPGGAKMVQRVVPKGAARELLRVPGQPVPRVRGGVETLSPALRDPTLNRLLDNKRPIQLEPQ